MMENPPIDLSYEAVCRFLYREARLIDDKDWDAWLECYASDVEYWMPAWDDDGQLTTDPATEISLIYYPNRQGLEDRVFRVRTARSSASEPEPRTCHAISNVELLTVSEDRVEVRYNWQTLSHRAQTSSQFFGTSFVTLDAGSNTMRIVRKKIVLKDDYIHQVIDFYHL